MIKTEYHKDLTRLNTFGMKVKTRCFIEYDSVADLVDIEFDQLARPVLHIGGGSNLLFTDDFKGTVLHSKIDFIEILENHPEGMSRLASQENGDMLVSSSSFLPEESLSDCHPECSPVILSGSEGSAAPVLVSVGAGVVFDDFCQWAAQQGLWGVENLSYIPGEVGASAVQNIGAYGVEVKDVIDTVYCYDTVEEEFVKFSVEECGYGYRDSIFKKLEIKGRYIVTHVVFALSSEPQPRLDYGHLATAVAEATSASGDPLLTPSLIRKVIIRIRKEKLPEPSVMGSAGSFFKNPVITLDHFRKIEAEAKAEYGPDYKVPHYDLPDDMVKVPAAWMIEQCGWKGRRSGGAAVYDKQPLVIVNYTGDAYPEEIIGLERRIIDSVKHKFGVGLHPEVEHI